jgi:hypothetical protein
MAEDKVSIHITNVPQELYEEAKIKALREKRPLTEVVRELLEKWVDEPPKKEAER